MSPTVTCPDLDPLRDLNESLRVVYVYGVPARLDGHTVARVREVDEQLWLAHRLREQLVAIEHEWEQRKAAIWSAVPQIADVEAQLAALEEEIETLTRQAGKERSQRRARGATASSTVLAERRRQRKDLRAQRKELIAQVRADHADELAANSDRRAAEIKATYAEFCQTGVPDRETGTPKKLYWATYNQVLRHHKVAASRIQAVRAQGRPAQLRHHRWDGSGAVSVQLQRQAGMQPRTPATIADGETGKWRNVLHLPGWVDPAEWAKLSRAEQRADRLRIARLCVGEGRMVELPVIVHRMLPPEADITGAQIVTVRVGPDTRTRLHITATLPPPQVAGREPAVALHLGWRRDAERGEVTVATWRSTHPVTVPARLDARRTPGAPLVVDTDRTGRIVLGARWLDRVAHYDDVRGERDTALNEVKAELVAWLDRHPGGVQWRDQTLTGPGVAQWRAPGRFAVLAMSWVKDPPEGGEDIAARLEQWRAHDLRRWRTEAHGRMRTLDNRTDTYRVAVRFLAGLVGTLVVDDTDLSQIARRPNPERGPELPSVVEQRAARQRTLAAVGRLRQIAVDTATREGVAVLQVPHTGITRTHYRCRHLNPADGRYAASRIVLCDGCGQSYNQDSSATLLMLAAAGHAPRPV